MEVRDPRRERWNVAVAAVSCGRLTQAEVVRAIRGRCQARADQYGVNVTESRWHSPGSSRRAREPVDDGELVVEHWGGDAEMLAFDFIVKDASRRLDPVQHARVAARTVRDYALDSLRIDYPDGAELTADRAGVVLRGPRRGRLRQRGVVIRAALDELL